MHATSAQSAEYPQLLQHGRHKLSFKDRHTVSHVHTVYGREILLVSVAAVGWRYDDHSDRDAILKKINFMDKVFCIVWVFALFVNL